MRKAHRKKPLMREDIERNKEVGENPLSCRTEFCILHRIFRCKRANYLGIEKVKGKWV